VKTALQRLGFRQQTTPEGLGHKDFYKNCNYQNNGYGSDYITHNTLIEAKLRSHYLEPRDFWLNVLPRFFDLDPYHKMEWLLIIWGKVSDRTRGLIKQHGIHLIVVPFVIDHRTLPSQSIIQLATAYIAEQLKTMALFTLANREVSLSTCSCYCGVVVEGNYEYYRVYFDSASASSRCFDPLKGREYQHLRVEAVKMWNTWQEYISLTYPLDASTRRWLNELDVYAQMTREEWLQP